MKRNPDFLMREVADTVVVVPVGAATTEFHGMITLNETGAFLWEKLQVETSEEALISALLAEYDVDEATARRSVAAFVGKLKENGFIAG